MTRPRSARSRSGAAIVIAASALVILVLIARASPVATSKRRVNAPRVNVLGVNALPPAQYHADDPKSVAEWTAYDALLASLPKGTPVRASVYWHEWAWDKNWDKSSGGTFEHVERKVSALARAGHPVTWEVTPLPWPGSPGWTTTGVWGQLAKEDLPELDARFKRFVRELRESMRRNGMPERGTRFQIGNELGAGHPGGDGSLPQGEWSPRIGALYERMVRGTDFGGMMLILPALSFQDFDPKVAARERATAGPILRRIARAKTNGGAVAAAHSRLYGPELKTGAYAAKWLSVLNARLDLARGLSGRPYAIATEVYVFPEDRGANADRAEVLRRIAPKIPRGVFLYKVGAGGDNGSAAMSVATIRAAQNAARAAAQR